MQGRQALALQPARVWSALHDESEQWGRCESELLVREQKQLRAVWCSPVPGRPSFVHLFLIRGHQCQFPERYQYLFQDLERGVSPLV